MLSGLGLNVPSDILSTFKTFKTSKTSNQSTWRALLWVALGFVLIYGLFCLFYQVEILSRPRLNREVFTWLSALSLGYLYYAGYRNVSLLSKTITGSDGYNLLIAKSLRWFLVGFAVIFALFALATPNFHSTDLLGYVNRGWQQWHYHTNPYVTVIDDIKGWEQDPMLSNHWVSNPSPYGFLFIRLTYWLCALGDYLSPGSLPVTALLFKVVNVLVMALCSVLLWFGVKKSQGEPAALRTLYLFSWSPLLLLHQISNGHNDLMMGLGIAASGAFALLGGWVWVLPALMAATLVKYAALIAIPFAIVFLWRLKAYKNLVLGGLFSLMLVFSFGWPYLHDWQSFNLNAIQQNAQISHSSLHSFLYSLYKAVFILLPEAVSYKLLVKALLKQAILGIFALLLILWGLRALGLFGSLFKKLPQVKFMKYTCCFNVWEVETGEKAANSYIEAISLVLFFLVCFVTFKFYPWYVAMIFPTLLLLPEGHGLRRLGVIFTVSHLLSITFVGQAHILNYLLMILLPGGLFLVGEYRRNACKKAALGGN